MEADTWTAPILIHSCRISLHEGTQKSGGVIVLFLWLGQRRCRAVRPLWRKKKFWGPGLYVISLSCTQHGGHTVRGGADLLSRTSAGTVVRTCYGQSGSPDAFVGLSRFSIKIHVLPKLARVDSLFCFLASTSAHRRSYWPAGSHSDLAFLWVRLTMCHGGSWFWFIHHRLRTCGTFTLSCPQHYCPEQ